MEDNWQEAEMGQKSKSIPALTTDDLVLWIGEYAIKEKQQGRTSAFQQEKIQALESEVLKAKSVSGGSNTKIEKLTAENSKLKTETIGLTASLETVRNESHPRIVQLEEQIHIIALERDNLLGELTEIKKKKKRK